MDKAELELYEGGCHCKRVRFNVWADKNLTVFKCNCSICTMKQNHHFIVAKEKFTLLQGEEDLNAYTFNTHQAKHKFCKYCGVQAFYHPRSHPDGIAVTLYCLDRYPKNISYNMVEFDGQNWESEINENKDIKKEI
jgi:hypothetical protein